jgi:hypothetical protein
MEWGDMWYLRGGTAMHIVQGFGKESGKKVTIWKTQMLMREYY